MSSNGIGEDGLRSLIGEPSELVQAKVSDRLNDTFRVNGTATIVTDPELLEACAVEGKTPKLGLRIEIQEAFTYCSKAFLRAQLWDPDCFVDREELPSAGELWRSVEPAVDPDTYDAERYARREGFY